MPNLHWTMPVARWSFWSATSPTAPDLSFIEPMVRRRLSSLSRMALKVAHDCAAGHDAVRMVFASRHGELRRTTDILHAITAAEPVSPNAFSLSVLNAMSGMFGIARGDRSAASAISAGAETLGYALLEAHAQYAEQSSTPLLVVYADEPADALYGPVEEEVEGGALALLLDTPQAQCELACAVAPESPTDRPQNAEATRFTTQAAALVHCLERRSQSSWHSHNATWQWRWHGGTA